MKLIKQFGRKYENKTYYKFLTVIPNKLIKALGWKGGEDLEPIVKDGHLVIKKK